MSDSFHPVSAEELEANEVPVQLEAGVYYLLFPPATDNIPVQPGQQFFYCFVPSPHPILWDYRHEYGYRRSSVQLEIMVNVLQWGPKVTPLDRYGTRLHHALFVGPLPSGSAEWLATRDILARSESGLGIEKSQVLYYSIDDPF